MIGNVNSGMFTKDHAAKSFSGQVARLMPAGDAPLFGLTSMLKTETALQFNHGYFSKTMVFPAVTLSASALISDTVLNVVSTANVIPGMVLRVDGTGENVYVTGVIGNSQLQVQRAFGQVAAVAISNSVLLIQVGNANEESSLMPLAFTIQMVFDTNFTQIFRNTWAVSGTAAETRMIAGEGNIGESKMDCAAMHAADIEKALFFGQKYIGTRNGQLFHTMDGILSILTQKVPANITTLGSTTTFTQLENAVDPLFNVRSDQMSGTERLMFVGGTARRVLNKIAQLNGTYFIQEGETAFGLQFSTFKLTRGTFRIIEHPLFNAFGTSSTYAKMAVIVDMPAFNLAYLGNRKTKAMDMVGEDGTDAVSGTLLTELTMLIKNPQAFGVLFNFTAGATG